MSEIEVVAHGDRWAVRRGDDTVSEYLTREEAESEARRMGDAQPRVETRDPTGLDRVQDDVERGDGQDAGPDGVVPSELARESQAGL